MLRNLSVTLVCCLPIGAQQFAPSPIQADGPRQAIARHCGLQADGNGPGLVGGGADYEIHFAADGARFEAVLGRGCPTTQFLGLQPTAVRRGGETLLNPS